MNHFKQLAQWPPTTSTVIGVGLLVGVADFMLTGSVTQAVSAAGVFKIVCPEATGATDRLTQILDTLMNNLGKGAAK